MDERKKLKINRYPETNDKSLKAWNAADEMLLEFIKKETKTPENIIIYHDRFGYLSCHLQHLKPKMVITYNSQEKSIKENLHHNQLNSTANFLNPLEKIDTEIDYAIIKIPKSIELFELYLNQLLPSLGKEATVICGFMTKYFSTQSLKMAAKYFEELEQTKARKKARLLLLKKPKTIIQKERINELYLPEKQLVKQYYGVFSAAKIDMATQFLIDHLQVKSSQKKILDLGCGNGILALKARELNPDAHIHLSDDNFLAIESAKLNLGSSPTNHYHFTDHLLQFENNTFDLVISNPPFHFEYENNIEITLNLFQEVYRVLKPNSNFQLVANLHLNYKTHLKKLFPKVAIVAKNEKFIIYNCIK